VSHDATAWAKAQRTGNGPAKAILMVLADYASTDYSCYPSVGHLSEVTEFGESTVRAATKLLAERGLIRVFYRYRDNHTRRSSRYQLLVDGADTAEPDAEDWADRRREPCHQRQEPAHTPQEPADSHRQELALIPSKDPSLREPSPVIPGAARTAKATRIPDDFFPTPEMQEWFKNEGFDRAIPNPRQEHEKFCDYWRAKAGPLATKKDWPATWRNWMRTTAERQISYSPRGNNGPRLQSTTDMKVRQTLDLAEKFRQMEEDQ
jgi:Helix-turn-helix domain